MRLFVILLLAVLASVSSASANSGADICGQLLAGLHDPYNKATSSCYELKDSLPSFAVALSVDDTIDAWASAMFNQPGNAKFADPDFADYLEKSEASPEECAAIKAGQYNPFIGRTYLQGIAAMELCDANVDKIPAADLAVLYFYSKTH